MEKVLQKRHSQHFVRNNKRQKRFVCLLLCISSEKEYCGHGFVHSDQVCIENAIDIKIWLRTRLHYIIVNKLLHLILYQFT